MLKRALPTLAILALAVLAAAPALAAGKQKPWAYDLAGELMSPFCPGRTLADCPSEQAKQLVMWMVVQEGQGRTRADVEKQLLTRYGEVMRPAPTVSGIGLTAYLIPAAVFVGGGLLVGFFLARQTRGARPGPVPSGEPDPELERIVDEELAGS